MDVIPSSIVGRVLSAHYAVRIVEDSLNDPKSQTSTPSYLLRECAKIININAGKR